MAALQARYQSISTKIYGRKSSMQGIQQARVIRDKQAAIRALQAPIGKEIQSLMGREELARTDFGNLFSQAGGSTEGGSTWNNSINITVSDSSGNIDDIIQKIGPKLLKYLQENESRIGIR